MKLNGPISRDPEVVLEGKLEHLRLYLAHYMRSLREGAELTQGQLAERLNKKQAAVSKLESSLVSHDLESVVRYLSALDAELLVAIKHGGEIRQVSDNEEHLIVDVPVEVGDWARKAKTTTRAFMRGAVERCRGAADYAILPMTVTIGTHGARKAS